MAGSSKEYNRRWRAANREKSRKYQREYQRKYRQLPHVKEYRVAAQRKYFTGFTAEMFAERFAAQNGLCAICGVAPATDADHDHATKQPRGVLCGHCNRGLGHFFDDPAKLQSAADYLRRWSA